MLATASNCHPTTSGSVVKVERRVRFADAEGLSISVLHEFQNHPGERVNMAPVEVFGYEGTAEMMLSHQVCHSAVGTVETYLKWRLLEVDNVPPSVKMKSWEKSRQEVERQQFGSSKDFLDSFVDFSTEVGIAESSLNEKPVNIPLDDATQLVDSRGVTGGQPSVATIPMPPMVMPPQGFPFPPPTAGFYPHAAWHTPINVMYSWAYRMGMPSPHNMGFVVPNAPRSGSACKFFAQNRCNFGVKCKFGHDGETKQPPPKLEEPTPPPLKPPRKQKRGKAKSPVKAKAGGDHRSKRNSISSSSRRGQSSQGRAPSSSPAIVLDFGRAPLRRLRYDEEQRRLEHLNNTSKSRSRSPRPLPKASLPSRSRSPVIARQASPSKRKRKRAR